MKLLEIQRPLDIQTFQTASVNGVDAAQGVYTLKRIYEMAN